MACISKRQGRYVIDFYDHHGKRRWKTLPKGTTKVKARELMREIDDQLARGIWLPEKKVPLFKDVAKDWLKFKRPNVRESTWVMYDEHLKHHFENLNEIRVNRITSNGKHKIHSKSTRTFDPHGNSERVCSPYETCKSSGGL